MNKTIKIIVLFTATLFSMHVAKAQATDFETNTEINLPPLQVVIDSVLSRNGMIKFRNNHIGVMESTLASEKMYWTKNVGIQAESKYGNINNFATSANSTGSSDLLTTSTQFNYSAGVYLKLPIFDVINRKQQLRLAKLELDEAKSMAQFQKDEVRQTVIKMYQDLILKQKILKIKSKILGDGRVNMDMVEKEFRNGVVEISEYVRITGMTTTMEIDYEAAKSDFITSKQLLEDMAGFVFKIN